MDLDRRSFLTRLSAAGALASPTLVQLYKWSFAALLMLPQSVLLGMTFPLMANGVIRRFPATPR